MESETQFIAEIKALLQGGGNAGLLLLKSRRLAYLRGDVWHEELFKLHFEGLDLDDGEPAPDVAEEFHQDRMLSTGHSDTRPLRQLELWHHDLPTFALKVRGEGHESVADEIPLLMSELATIIGRIKDRVATFVTSVEAGKPAAGPGPTPAGAGLTPPADAGPRRIVSAGTRPTAKPVLTLIMKGGGIKGLAYVGALKELNRFYDFDWYAGTSAGAITAALLAAGVKVAELERLLKVTNFKKVLFDAPKRQLLHNLYHKGGLYPGVKFQAWIGDIINNALNSPVPVHLNDLPKFPSVLKHRLTVYASTDHKRTLVYDSNSEASSGTRVSFAVRCSMSIPFLFVSEVSSGAQTLDGGVHNNYPVAALLADNPGVDFIGLYLGPEVYEEEGHRPSALVATIKGFFSSLFGAADMEALREHRDKTIVIDPRPVSTIDFDLTDEEKDFLLKAGRASALRFLHARQLPGGPTAEQVAAAKEEARQAKEAVITRRTESVKHWRFMLTHWFLFLVVLPLFLAAFAAGLLWLLW